MFLPTPTPKCWSFNTTTRKAPQKREGWPRWVKPEAGQPGIVGPWRRHRGARSAWALPHPASRSHMLRHAIVRLRSGWTRSGEQLMSHDSSGATRCQVTSPGAAKGADDTLPTQPRHRGSRALPSRSLIPRLPLPFPRQEKSQTRGLRFAYLSRRRELRSACLCLPAEKRAIDRAHGHGSCDQGRAASGRETLGTWAVKHARASEVLTCAVWARGERQGAALRRISARTTDNLGQYCC
jgi:hypothetical protein